MTTVFNGAGEGSAKASWVLMRRTRADTFRSASSRKNLYCFSKLHVAEPKNRTCIGPHSRTQKYQRFPSWKPAMSGGLKLKVLKREVEAAIHAKVTARRREIESELSKLSLLDSGERANVVKAAARGMGAAKYRNSAPARKAAG